MYVKYLILHLGDVHVHNNSISLCESKFQFLNYHSSKNSIRGTVLSAEPDTVG